MLWANFLHMYQPPTQKEYWVKRITSESYRPVFRGLLERPSVRLTVNINGVLVELLEKYGETDVIDDIRTLLERDQIELTGSSKYHAILPFLPEHEIKRQITLNNQVLQRHFGEAYQPKGFFPPEMAIASNVTQVVEDMGFEWIIADELSHPNNEVDYARRYSLKRQDLGIYLRERELSWGIMSAAIGTVDALIREVSSRPQDTYILTAMDGETFGHHRPGLETLLFDLADFDKVKSIQVSDLPGLFPAEESIDLKPSTWALMPKEQLKDNPFSRWKGENHEIHALQWELTNLALDVYEEKHQKLKNLEEDALDRALHSDQYWWASAQPWWSIEMIERGAYDYWQAIVAADWAETQTKNLARRLYEQIVLTAFDWQRTGKVDEMAKTEDEELRAHHEKNTPKLKKEDIAPMIERLEQQLDLVIENAEYERATVLRNRIKELKERREELSN